MRRKGLYLAKEDERMLATIMSQYGCVSESQAARLALRALVSRPLLSTVELPPPGKPGPKSKDGKGKRRE